MNAAPREQQIEKLAAAQLEWLVAIMDTDVPAAKRAMAAYRAAVRNASPLEVEVARQRAHRSAGFDS